ncbi:hypothetical protein V8F33_001336 [Rhypophila sp. PSN 637]
MLTSSLHRHSIKKPKTSRYPSLKGTDPKFRRNHRHALHGTAKALVRNIPIDQEAPSSRRQDTV